MIKTKKLFNNISDMFKKNKRSQTTTSKTMFDSKISKINLILDSSENYEDCIISACNIPAPQPKLQVLAGPEPQPHLPARPEPPAHARSKAPAALKTDPPIHTRPKPSVHTRPEPPVHTKTDQYKKDMREIDRLQLKLRQMEKSCKS